MDLFEAIEKRKSIRRLKNKAVSRKDIEKIIEAACLAPSAMNQQPWKFVVIEDAEKKKKIRSAYNECRKALGVYEQDTEFVENGTLVAVFMEPEKHRPVFSTALAVENLLLAATALGYGSIVMTAPVSHEPSNELICRLCKKPDGLELAALLIIGYSDEDPERKERREIKEVLFFEDFDL